MFFELNLKSELSINYDAAALVPEFAVILSDPALGKPAFKFIIMAYNALSPYRHLPEERRITKVIEDTFRKKSKVEAIDSKKMRDAIDKYLELQAFSADFDEYYSINEKCIETTAFIRDTPIQMETIEALEKAGKMLTVYNKLKNDLKELLFSRIEKGDLKRAEAGRTGSYMERYWQEKNGKKNSKATSDIQPSYSEGDSET